jgi:hypothetical protein
MINIDQSESSSSGALPLFNLPAIGHRIDLTLPD